MDIANRLRQLREWRHLSQGDIEERTGLLRCYVSRVDEPDVLRVGSNGSTNARKYVLLRIPESVAVRVHRRLSAVPK